MDRALMARLYEVTADDDTKAPEDVLKVIVKATVKASVKELQLVDMAQWLGKRLATDHCGAKIKVLRLIMMIISNPKGGKFADAINSEAIDVIRDTASFSCPPDPVHGDKPAEFVRVSATKCIDLLGVGMGAAPAPAKSPPPGSPVRPAAALQKQLSADIGGERSLSPGMPSPSRGSPGPSPGRGSGAASSPARPKVEASAVSKEFSQAIQIDMSGRDAMKLPASTPRTTHHISLSRSGISLTGCSCASSSALGWRRISRHGRRSSTCTTSNRMTKQYATPHAMHQYKSHGTML